MTVTRWIIAIGLLLVATAFVYWAAPNVNLRFRWITPGSILFCAGWLAATAAFAFYVDRFGSYNATYGTLGGVVVLLAWFYLTGYILLLGAELNAVLDWQRDQRQASPHNPRKTREQVHRLAQ